MLFKNKITILQHEIDLAVAEYMKKHKGISLGKIKYEYNRSAGLLVCAKAEILGHDMNGV